MENNIKWLALPVVAATVIFAYSFWPRGVKDYSGEDMTPDFASHLNDLEMRVHFGDYTSEDVEIAREKLYEITEDVKSLSIPSDMDRRMEYQFGDIYVISNTSAHHLLFIDRNADGMVLGSFDYMQVEMPSDWGEWEQSSYTLNSPPFNDSEQWYEDVEDLTGDYEQNLVLNYMKLLQYSDNGILKVGGNKYNLLD